MKRFVWLSIALPAAAFAQGSPPSPAQTPPTAAAAPSPTPSSTDRFANVRVEPRLLAPGVAMLTGAGGNMAVAFGDGPTLLVDSQFAELAPRVEAAISTLTPRAVGTLLNTHWHADHTGGNAAFARTGATIVAHANARQRLAAGQMLRGRAVQPATPSTLPSVTFADAGGTLHTGGGAVRARYFPAAHTDGDLVLFFERANVIHMGDIFFNGGTFPFIDRESGGSASGMLAAVEAVLARSDDATQIIPGHGPLARRSDLIAYRDMLKSVMSRVSAERARGRSLAQVIATRPAAQWDRFTDPFITADAFVTAVWEDSAIPRPNPRPRPPARR